MTSLEHAGILAGLLAGVLHALSGPDHLAAMAPLSVARPWQRWRTGLGWGLGHALGTWAIAVAALFARDLLPLEAFSAGSERLVGVALAVLGLWGLRRALRSRLHSHEHRHGGAPHRHFHVHEPAGVHGTAAHREHSHASVGIGVLHGLAGSGTLIAVVPAVALAAGGAFAYVIAYGLGGIAAMAAFTWLLGGLGARAVSAPRWAHPVLLGGCATLSIIVGGIWIFQ